MAFQPRTVEPPKTSKYYLSTVVGGYNSSILPGDSKGRAGYGSGSCKNVRGSVLHNCVGYARGRYMEIGGLKSDLALPRGNAGTWYGKKIKLSKGRTPKLGAILCMSYPGKAGHVAVVEQIYSNGDVLTSNSGWSKDAFFMKRHLKSANYSYGNYRFQGFIYHPNIQGGGLDSADPKTLFVQKAEEKIGKTKDYVNTTMNIKINDGDGWSASFICAVAKDVGNLLDKVIPFSFVIADMMKRGVERNMGAFFKGPGQLEKPSLSTFKPQIGDLVVIRYNYTPSQSVYYGHKIAIVKEWKNNKLTVIEGDCGGKVASRSYVGTSNQLAGYFRPNWDSVKSLFESMYDDEGEYGEGSGGGYVWEPLYDTEAKKTDAVIREIGYLNTVSYEPSITQSKVPLSVINYTPALGAYYAVFSGVYAGLHPELMSGSGGSFDGGGGSWTVKGRVASITFISKNPGKNYYTVTANGGATFSGSPPKLLVWDVGSAGRRIAEFFLDKGFKKSAVIGMLGYAMGESQFNSGSTYLLPNGKEAPLATSGKGIFAWMEEYFHLMTEVPNWRTNLSGQLEFAWKTLALDKSRYSFYNVVSRRRYKNNRTFLEQLNSYPETLAGAQDAAECFLMVYGDTNGQRFIPARRWNAKEIWNLTVDQLN